MTSFNDILTNILVVGNYPDVKREGFIRTFYEYLTVKMLNELEKTKPELYQKLAAYFSDDLATDREIQEGLQEAYQNPELKEIIDRVTEEVMAEFVADVANYSTEEQKKAIIAGAGQAS